MNCNLVYVNVNEYLNYNVCILFIVIVELSSLLKLIDGVFGLQFGSQNRF